LQGRFHGVPPPEVVQSIYVSRVYKDRGPSMR
jgi:hypothetical protein